MAGLPHFSNSKASRDNYEPVYLNQFEVIINPPNGIPLAAQRFKGEGILAQGVKSISGLAVDIAPSATTDQNYKFATRRYAGGEPSTTDMTVTMEFEVNLNPDTNSMEVYKILRQWSDLIYNPLTELWALKAIMWDLWLFLYSIKGEMFLEECLSVLVFLQKLYLQWI